MRRMAVVVAAILTLAACGQSKADVEREQTERLTEQFLCNAGRGPCDD